MKIAIRSFVIFSVFLGLRASGQDIHFSMFYASPITLNPALTGVIDGSYRVAGIYRNQYRSISTPFSTYSGSFDMRLLQSKLPNDIFGAGALFVGDKSGDGNLTANSGQLSAAFHKGLDKAHRHYIGLGVQFAYTQRSLAWQKLSFPDQFNTSIENFDPSVLSSVSLAKSNIGYFDMNLGILHQSNIQDKMGVMAGVSVYHLVQPKQSFLNENVKLSNRITAHAGLRIKVVKQFFINPNFIYQYQNKAQEFNMGASFEYHIRASKSDAIISLGGWYRLKDAAIITVGAEYYRVRLMFAYDINASSLHPATNGRGAFELAAIFTGIIKSNKLNYPVLVPCPMM